MNFEKPDYLTQEQYDKLFTVLNELNPPWTFISDEHTDLKEPMRVYKIWIGAVMQLNGDVFDAHDLDLYHKLRNDGNLMIQLNVYIELLQI